MTLPQEFKERMERLLGEEAQAFFESWQGDPARALRVNTLKIAVEELRTLAPFSLAPVPWEKSGFYFEKEDRPGRHPYHEAGLYYIQEPSAMAVGALAAPKPGERVLDLCAAPGGKTTHLASFMRGQGLLVANEIHPARAKILSSNVERMGIRNCVVTNESPHSLAKQLPCFFDRILVDAPCSGEGMFRKEEQARLEWSPKNVSMCVLRQQEILSSAEKMLRPGGVLIYSTCTFSPEENEGSVHTFLKEHPDFTIKKLEGYEGFSPGRPEWANACPETAYAFRLMPHRLKGEGHFVAVLQKRGEAKTREGAFRIGPVDQSIWKLYRDFEKETLCSELWGIPLLFGEQLYLLPEAFPLKGLKILRPGLHLGTVKKNRLEPAHALALALGRKEVLRSRSLHVQEANIYLQGAVLEGQGEKGWQLMLVDGYSIGWGKEAGGMVKNHYPKGLRKNS